ncbi:MAG: hypothetical protein AAFN07_09825 [Pseudomonadota bacterium]
MASIASWIESGRIADVMLLVIALEVLVLSVYRWRSGRGLTIPTVVCNAGAGGSLMVALKLVWIGAKWQWIAMALIASLVFHSVDLAQRWRAAAAPSS